MMLLSQVLGICLLAIEDPATRGILLVIVKGAQPACDIQMLRALVAFPVRLAAERLGAVGESTAVWSLVTLLVFPRDGKLAFYREDK